MGQQRCSGNDPIPGGAQEDNFGPRLATLTAVSGSGQFAAVGSTLAQPLVVRVRDQTGAAVEGAVVQWQITSTSPGALADLRRINGKLEVSNGAKRYLLK